VSPEPARVLEIIRFGDDYELDCAAYKLRRAGRLLKLERIPMEVLLVLVEQPGQLVTREQIAERIWGKGVFLDTDNSINGAIRKVRQILKDDPEQPRFIQTITGKGYRFIAPVLPAQVTAAQSLAAQPAPPVLEAKTTASRHWQAAAVGVLLVAGIGAYSLWVRSSKKPVEPPGRVMLAVLPFENLTGDPAQEYFSDGLTEEMITELGRINPARLGVIGRTSVMLYKHNPKSLDQVGRDLGVRYVIEGSVRRDANRVRIAAQLIQTRDQTHIWAREYDRDPQDLLSFQSEIAREIADEIQLTLGNTSTIHSVHASRSSGGTTSYEAHDFYLRGRYFWNKRTPADLQRAAEYFRQAVVKDPNYAQAYAGLADTYGLMSTWTFVSQHEFMPKARAAALRALELDDALAEGHSSLALIAENYDYDWETAEKEFRRALQLNPDYATAHQWYAELLSWQGRFDEAIAESERARQLDPLSPIIATDHAAILYFSRRYDDAIAQSRTALEMDPKSGRAQGIIGYSLVQKGKFQEALTEMDQPDNPLWNWAWKAYIYGRWHRATQAGDALARFEQVASRERSDLTFARLMAYVGTDNEQAITVLQKAYSDHSNTLTAIKVDPNYDPLRNDPRFQELIRRLGLPQ